MSKPKIIGELVIVAYKARHLPEREIVGKQDPFVIFRIGEAIQRTKTDLRGGQHPTWDDQVVLPIPEKKKKVVVQIYDEDGKRQELISECELDISKVLVEGEEDNWYPLTYKGRSAGEIYLELTFYSARPPPKRQPTRYGMSRPFKPPGGYVPTVPQNNNRPYPVSPQYPPQPVSTRPPPVPVESQSTPTNYKNNNNNSYPPQQRPNYNYNPVPRPYPPNPTPSMSTGTQNSYRPQHQQQQQQPYPPNNSRPLSYGGQPSLNPQRPISPPAPGSSNYANHLADYNAPLLSSSYNPTSTSRPNYGYPPTAGYPPNNSTGGYPPQNVAGNRNSYPNYSSNNNSFPQPHLFPEPQQFTGGFAPHSDHLGTPFAAHQGAYPPSNNQSYPPSASSNYPPSSGYPPY
ncbi:MAG: C2 domain-containing protein [Benjaminiella poitrasii]|nr:MAG: C2 domain-containing protein [Benjaminiella poitrasii]